MVVCFPRRDRKREPGNPLQCCPGPTRGPARGCRLNGTERGAGQLPRAHVPSPSAVLAPVHALPGDLRDQAGGVSGLAGG